MDETPIRSPKSDTDLLDDMLDCVKRIDRYTGGLRKETAERVGELNDATVYRLTILGEAASRVSEQFRSAHPQIPWRTVIGYRHIVENRLEPADWNRIWKIATDDLPALEGELHRILGLRPPSDRKMWGEE